MVRHHKKETLLKEKHIDHNEHAVVDVVTVWYCNFQMCIWCHGKKLIFNIRLIFKYDFYFSRPRMTELTGWFVCEECVTQVYELKARRHEGRLLCEECYLEANK